MDVAGIGELPPGLDPELAIVWLAVAAAYPKLAEHVTGPTPRAGITLATVVRAFHEQTVATGATVYPGLLAGLFERYPEGPFYARCFVDRSVTDTLVEDITAIWQDCIETLRKAKLKALDLPVIPWIDERLSDWAGRDIPPQSWVMEGWIPRGQCTGLYGVAGIHKTNLLIQLLLAKSKGLPFLGIPLAAAPVYGLFCEDRSQEVVRRATRIARQAWGFDSLDAFPDFHFASLVGVIEKELVTFDNGAMLPTTALDRLNRKIVEIGAHLAALDTLPHFYGGNEIVRRDVTCFISQLEGLGIGRECGLVFTAHPSQRGRQSGSLDSGSTGWEGGFRARLTLHDPDEESEDRDRNAPRISSNRRVLTLFKANYAAPGATIDTIVRDGVFFVTAVGPEAANRPPRSGALREVACDAAFLNLLAAVTTQGSYVSESAHSGRYAPKVFASRPDGKEFSLPEYARAMGRLFVAQRIKMGLHGWPASRANPCIVDTQAQPHEPDDPAPPPAEDTAPEPPLPPPQLPTKAERDAAIDAYLKLDKGEQALERPALSHRLLGPKQLKGFDALVIAAHKAAPTPPKPAKAEVVSSVPTEGSIKRGTPKKNGGNTPKNA